MENVRHDHDVPRTSIRNAKKPEDALEIAWRWWNTARDANEQVVEKLKEEAIDCPGNFFTSSWETLTKRLSSLQKNQSASNRYWPELVDAGVSQKELNKLYQAIETHKSDVFRLFLQEYLSFYKVEDNVGEVGLSRKDSARQRIRKYLHEGRAALRAATKMALDASDWTDSEVSGWKGDENVKANLVQKLLDFHEDSHDSVNALHELIISCLPTSTTSDLTRSPTTELRYATSALKASWMDMTNLEEDFNKTSLFYNITVAGIDKRKGRSKRNTAPDNNPQGEGKPLWTSIDPTAQGSTRASRKWDKKRKADEQGSEEAL